MKTNNFFSKDDIPTRREFIGSCLGGIALTWANNVGDGAFYSEDFNFIGQKINHIVSVILQRLKTVPEDETLFVPIGELHDKALHKIVMQGVVGRLRELNIGVAAGFEFSDHHLSEDIRRYQELRLSGQPVPKRLEANVDKAVMGIDADRGRQSVRQYLKYLLAENVPFDFNDLKSGTLNGKVILDPYSIENKAYADKIGLDLTKKISTSSPEGMYVRNLGIVERSIEFADRLKADGFPIEVQVQHTGSSHPVGTLWLPFAESLCGIYQDKKAYVLAVNLQEELKHTRPAEAKAFMEQGGGIDVSGVSGQSFDYTSIPDNQALINMEIAETDYLRRAADAARVRTYIKGPPTYYIGGMNTLPEPR